MLQVITKKYFREGAPLHTTKHRRVLYTNRRVVAATTIDLPIASLLPAASPSANPFVFIAEVIEHLEATDPDGNDSILIATSGDDLIEDLAVVLSFASNSVFSTNAELVRRVLSASHPAERGSAGALFKETFEPNRFFDDADIAEVREFVTALLDLRRDRYEAVMRAIRRIVHATRRAADDPTLAYVDLVAALESLAGSPDKPPLWERVDGRKRALVDAALKDASAETADRVRAAVADAEQAGARWRFEQFVLDHIGSEFFRAEAGEQLRPVRGPDLVPALRAAYEIRSRSVHALDDLPAHVTALNDQADTASAPSFGVMLTLQGLARLVRHVVGRAVARAPRGVDESFDWRSAVPGVLEVMLAPQYWLWNAEGFTHESAIRYFGGFADHVLELKSGAGEGVPPMEGVLEHIEKLARGTQPGPPKRAMVALYRAWHGVVHPEHHRPNAQAFIDAHIDTLAEPSMVAFATGLLCGKLPNWTTDQWRLLGEARRAERAKPNQLVLASRFDAALHAVISEELHVAGQHQDAVRFAGYAIEELPGDEILLNWETALNDGTAGELDVARLVFGAAQSEEDTGGAGGEEVDRAGEE